MNRPILCLDFDGVIHSYSSGWKGACDIPDPPVPGALEFLAEAVKHFRVAIYSSRSGHEGGISAMRQWLHRHLAGRFGPEAAQALAYSAIEWPTTKPPALVTIDDRCIPFNGVWPAIDDIKNFKPWNKRPEFFENLFRVEELHEGVVE